ncbi:MAG: hypothetical protein IIC21_07800 [Chloroflexi bacterium]|nr:hypothetical protein [Chloroflexota bacterium]
MHRFSATKMLLKQIGDLPVVANLGPTTDELWHAGQRDRNFYTYGSMGLCSSIALGMALSCDKVAPLYKVQADGQMMACAECCRDGDIGIAVGVYELRKSGLPMHPWPEDDDEPERHLQLVRAPFDQDAHRKAMDDGVE